MLRGAKVFNGMPYINADGTGNFYQYDSGHTAFNTWFVDSKVMDDNGTPKIVYHWTATNGIEVFDKKSNRQYRTRCQT